MSISVTTPVRGRLLSDVAMARYSTWRAGGPAAMLFMPADHEDLIVFLQGLAPEVPVYMIGLGSNLLVRDGGVDGVIIRLAPGLAELTLAGPGRIHVQAGVAMPKLARFAAQHSLGQAGFMAGIPGSVGGALAMNAGCFGASTWDSVVSVSVITPSGQLVDEPADQFAIGYRYVHHPKLEPLWFVAAAFALPPAEAQEQQHDRAMLEQRAATQPIGTANAGSVFRNPDGDSAGRLIETAGLAGANIGGVAVSSKHCNFFINDGAATAADIEALITHVQDRVLAHSGVNLELEVRIIGVHP